MEESEIREHSSTTSHHNLGGWSLPEHSHSYGNNEENDGQRVSENAIHDHGGNSSFRHHHHESNKMDTSSRIFPIILSTFFIIICMVGTMFGAFIFFNIWKIQNHHDGPYNQVEILMNSALEKISALFQSNTNSTSKSVGPRVLTDPSKLWQNCSYVTNFTQSSLLYDSLFQYALNTSSTGVQYNNFFNDRLLSPVIGKIECEKIMYFQSPADVKRSNLGIFYRQVVEAIEQETRNLFVEGVHLFYPIMSVFQVAHAENTKFDICEKDDALFKESLIQLRGNNSTLLQLIGSIDFQSCEQFFCQLDTPQNAIMDPFKEYLSKLHFHSIYTNSTERMHFYNDLYTLSAITNRCQYCSSQSNFRQKTRDLQCPFMINYPTRAAERSCLGKRGFPIFYPSLALDQYLQFSGNPFLCYCYDYDQYASRCDTLSNFIFPFYLFFKEYYIEAFAEGLLFVMVFTILILPLLYEVFKRGRYFYKDIQLMLKLLSALPLWFSRLAFVIFLSLPDPELLWDKPSMMFVFELIRHVMDSLGFEYVFVPVLISWNQLYEKLKLYTLPQNMDSQSVKNNAVHDFTKPKLFKSSIVLIILSYSLLIVNTLGIFVISMILLTSPSVFYEQEQQSFRLASSSAGDVLIPLVISLVALPPVFTNLGFMVLSFLISKQMQKASDVSFRKTNYVSISTKYFIMSTCQLIPAILSVVTLYFGYDSVTALIFYISTFAGFVLSDLFEIYVLYLLHDKENLKLLYVDGIWKPIFLKAWNSCLKLRKSKRNVSNNYDEANEIQIEKIEIHQMLNDPSNTTSTSNTYYSQMD
ncbi:hypothetical protein C9374_009188 [Naegleria lovaniensis]|uniref:Transmembrane protein n=1 Tax=Naegleria lovaniensis TaxID=51637 RepID=A0AA88GHW4_NAELO|nr:uncharacterized protein C9374_009188 [Naegleria lovaniensis]KAG2377672.1 hypothetical protein C9374_009188 [Naegleria lovaniensis]